nr:hypothetical protein CFP56_54433 [Quercus suber]
MEHLPDLSASKPSTICIQALSREHFSDQAHKLDTTRDCFVRSFKRLAAIIRSGRSRDLVPNATSSFLSVHISANPCTLSCLVSARSQDLLAIRRFLSRACPKRTPLEGFDALAIYWPLISPGENHSPSIMAEDEIAHSFASFYVHLTTKYGYPALPTFKTYAYEPSLSHAISSLALHPTLEALLHILNNDLPSAHFLCRHMQNAPAWEGMYIHGLLHRVEGDYRNTEAWYGNVAESRMFQRVWPRGLDSAKDFVRNVESLRKDKLGDEDELRRQSRREFDAVAEWCVEQFGTERWDDATAAWVEPSEENRKIASKMLVGGEGWRQF